MSRHFNPGATEYLTVTAMPLSAPPFTMACWVKLDQLPSNYGDEFTVFALTDFDAVGFFNLRADDGTDAVQFYASSGAAQGCTTTTDVTAGIWEHYCAIEIATNSRAVYLNGGSKGVNAGNQDPFGIATPDRIYIGAYAWNSTLYDYTDGQIAEAAIWDVQLTDPEIASLAAGFPPLLIRPQSLVFYAPLIRGLNDRILGNNLTANGSTVDAHSPIIYPAAPYIITAPAAVVGRTTKNTNASSLGTSHGDGSGFFSRIYERF